jgi:hypothetical protein
MSRTIAAAFATTTLIAAWASAHAGPNPKDKTMKLNPGLEPLTPFLGEWDCVETFHAGGFTPKEVTARGTDVLRVGPGGNAIIADYASTGELGPYAAHDMITWDDADKRFHYLFIDSFSPAVQLHTGKAVGQTFVFEGPFAFAGKPGTLRRTYRDITATAATLVVDFLDANGKATQLVTIKKTRKK